MSPISVYLNIGTHPIYHSLLLYPPRGIRIINKKPQITEKLTIYSKRFNLLRKMTTRISYFFRVPRMFYFRAKAELIHTSRGIIPLNKKPWVMDIEHAKSFFDDHKILYSPRGRKIVKKFLFSKYCKKLMPHCQAAKKSLLYHFGKELGQKIEVVYPAIPIQKFRVKQKKENSVKILFVANKFYEKGGLELLQSFEVLKRKYEKITLVMKAKVPPEIEKKLPSNVKIIKENLPYSKLLREVFATSHMFVFPTYIDTFGFALLEAMSVGLPIVATNIFAIPEIIEDGKNGFLIDAKKYDWSNENGIMKEKWLLHPEQRMSMYKKRKHEVVKQLVEKLSLLIEDSSLRKRMGRNGRKIVKTGKFSLKERNKRLRRIYEEALKY